MKAPKTRAPTSTISARLTCEGRHNGQAVLQREARKRGIKRSDCARLGLVLWLRSLGETVEDPRVDAMLDEDEACT